MWVFLASEVLFFSVLFFGYLGMRFHHPQGFAEGSHRTDWVLGSANTAVLLTSSMSIALAAFYAKAKRVRLAAALLAMTLLLGTVFLGIKILEYTHDFENHLAPWLPFAATGADVVGMKQFFLLYFVMTGAHAVHLIIGMGVVVLLLVRALRSKAHRTKVIEGIELGGLYWHLVDIIWIFIFPLLYLVARV